jgi:catalase
VATAAATIITITGWIRIDAQRAQFVDQVAGSLLGGVRSPVLERAFEYWKNVDPATGQQIEDKVRAGSAPEPAEGMGEG